MHPGLTAVLLARLLALLLLLMAPGASPEAAQPAAAAEARETRAWAPAVEGVWSPLLEEWAILARDQKVMKGPSTGYVVNSGGGAGSAAVSSAPGRREVSETDLYLLGAIEKLVYRVDFLDKRLRRAEELLYHLAAGGASAADINRCHGNFTRLGKSCYYFGTREYNWKSAASTCKTLAANLAELESIEENQDMVAYIQSQHDLQGKDYWTGGLNPGLLWIWSNSARPISANTTSGSSSSIRGNGRCLKLAYNPPVRSYAYLGADCSSRNYFICEYEENTTSRSIDRLAKSLNLPQP